MPGHVNVEEVKRDLAAEYIGKDSPLFEYIVWRNVPSDGPFPDWILKGGLFIVDYRDEFKKR